jgi:PAS domain S-box-containing protein
VRAAKAIVLRVGVKRKGSRGEKLYPVRRRKNISQEEQFRLLVEGAEQYAMLLLDEDNLITFWSRGAKKLFGWSWEEVLGKKGDIIFTPEDRKAGQVKKEFGKARREGCAVDRRWHMNKDGSRISVDGLLVALKDLETGETRGFAKICRDATEQHKASEELQHAHRELEQRVAERTNELTKANAALQHEIERRKVLEREILGVTERERSRISQDLHDTLCQELSATAFLLKSRANALRADNPKCANSLQEAAHVVNQNVGLARDMARNLQPLAVLRGSLTFALRELASRTKRKVFCRCECPRGLRVKDQNISVQLFGIAHEAVNNILKHAKASHIVIGLERHDDALVLYISDDGAGFRPTKKRRGLGIDLMMYRADVVGGKLSIDSQSGRGTTVTCRVPSSRAAGRGRSK